MEKSLDRASIMRAAFDLLSDQGLDALSTRKVAVRLGVQQPSLYWHFRNKTALLSAMVEDMLDRGGAHSTPVPDETWQTFISRSAHAFRKALLACRDGGRLFAGTKVIPARLDAFEKQLHYLVTAGLNLETAVRLTISVGHYVIGCVIAQQASDPFETAEIEDALERHPYLKAALADFADPDAVFEFGLAGIIRRCTERHEVEATTVRGS